MILLYHEKCPLQNENDKEKQKEMCRRTIDIWLVQYFVLWWVRCFSKSIHRCLVVCTNDLPVAHIIIIYRIQTVMVDRLIFGMRMYFVSLGLHNWQILYTLSWRNPTDAEPDSESGWKPEKSRYNVCICAMEKNAIDVYYIESDPGTPLYGAPGLGASTCRTHIYIHTCVCVSYTYFCWMALEGSNSI